MKIASHVVLSLTAILSVAHGWSSLLNTPLGGKTRSSFSSSSRLFISSWGTKGSPYTGGGEAAQKNMNPEENVQSYLKEASAVEARNNVDGTCLVSGVANDRERTDQFIFDLLNDEDSAFEFTKIIAYVKDSKFSKKRLLSRSARYTGLLDKLSFVEGAAALPTAEQLEGVNTWVAVIEDNHLDQMSQVAQLATQVGPSLKNVAILLVGASDLDAAASQQVMVQFPELFNAEVTEGDDSEPIIPPTSFTIVAVGDLDEVTPEGSCYYQFEEFGLEDGVIPSDAVFPRQESYRMITELLQLACGRQQALSFAQVYNSNTTEARLIKGLRSAGYARPQEIDHMIRQGVQPYKTFVEEWKKENPDAAKGYTTDAWWEADIYQNSRLRSAERDAAKVQVVVDEKTKEIEAIAKEWVKREYFRQSMDGSLSSETATEEEFSKQVWDKAMMEAELKHKQMNGEEMDEEAERNNFAMRQERKEVTMLKRAKKELAELLDEDPDTLIPPETDDDEDKKKD